MSTCNIFSLILVLKRLTFHRHSADGPPTVRRRSADGPPTVRRRSADGPPPFRRRSADVPPPFRRLATLVTPTIPSEQWKFRHFQQQTWRLLTCFSELFEAFGAANFNTGKTLATTWEDGDG